MSKLTCGLIMPISAFDVYTVGHWVDVKSILIEAVGAISSFQFDTSLVSDADESGVIHKRIVQNVYDSSIVICDVSGKNPNVMLELGMRLAFDKPTVIIKDDNTGYSFDTGVIEHISYPRDLRFPAIVEFKKRLADKVEKTYKSSSEGGAGSSFLASFGQFHTTTLSQTEVSPDVAILETLSDIQKDIRILKRRERDRPAFPPGFEILWARYGAGGKAIDVTQELTGMVDSGKLHVRVDNQIGGDPAPGATKALTVKYFYEGKLSSVQRLEGEDLDLP